MGEIRRDRKETGARWLSVLVRFKDKPASVYKQEVECTGDDDGFYCGRDCDGGGFYVSRTGDTLTLSQDRQDQGLRLVSSL